MVMDEVQLGRPLLPALGLLSIKKFLWLCVA